MRRLEQKDRSKLLTVTSARVANNHSEATVGVVAITGPTHCICKPMSSRREETAEQDTGDDDVEG